MTPTTEKPRTGAEAEALLARAKRLLRSLDEGTWISNGLNAGGGLTEDDQATKPIQQLEAAGLGWLVEKVRPLQEVHDRMRLDVAAIRNYADAWQRTGEKISSVAEQLAGCVRTDTESWCGVAGDEYRARAAEMVPALQAAATLAAAKSAASIRMGEVTSDARRQVGELLTRLVGELISYVNQAVAAQGGITTEIVSQATQMIDSYAKPIADIEKKLNDSAENLLGPGASGRADQVMTDDQALGMMGLFGAIYKDIARWLNGQPNTDLPEVSPPGGRIPGARTPSVKRSKDQEVSGTPQERELTRPWPRREDYDNPTSYGRDKHNALAEIQRPFEGTQLRNGWEVSKVERTAGGTKRVDVMYVNHEQRRVVVEDYVTGRLESVEHANKGWRYMYEPEIQVLRDQGYQFDYVPSFTDRLQ
ncbi:MAG: hypothetical protein WBA97_07900 [Actinophytocola sp.]|uniref:hypothetical protein n=1 Tax=Actinophytocola sp. TaxID=1872138 RepID=UPI003C75B211